MGRAIPDESISYRLQEAFLRRAGVSLIEDHYVLGRLLRPNAIAADFGANIGSFSREISAMYGCRCVAVEPAQENYDRIPCETGITKILAAVGAKDGYGKLFLSGDIEAHTILNAAATAGHADSIPVEILSYTSILKKAGVPNAELLKIDIEGAEWELLTAISDQELRSILQITVEFHDFVLTLREKSRTKEIWKRLDGLGFIRIVDVRRGSYNTLFVNIASGQVPLSVQFWLALSQVVGQLRRWSNGLRRRLGVSAR